MCNCGWLLTASCSLLVLEAVVTASTPDSLSSAPELDAVCHHDGACAGIENAECNTSTRQCSCKVSFSPLSKTSCGRKIGEDCHLGTCHATNSKCDPSNNKCGCDSLYTPSKDGTFCYTYPLLHGDLCEYDANCTSLGQNMECSEHKCVCQKNYFRWESQCMEKIERLGDACDEFTQLCYEDDVDFHLKRVCGDGICRCAQRFVPHNETCKEKISLLGAPCNDIRQACYVDSDGKEQRLHCYEGVCQCNQHYFLHDAKCKKKIRTLNTNCSYDKDFCADDMEPKHARTCLNGTCQCNEAFLPVRGSCPQKIGLLGATCNSSTQICHVHNEKQQNMECRQGTCQCKDGLILRGTRCEIQMDAQCARSSAHKIFYFQYFTILILILRNLYPI